MGSCGSPLVFFGGFNPPKDDPGIQSKLKGFQVYIGIQIHEQSQILCSKEVSKAKQKILHLAEMHGKCTVGNYEPYIHHRSYGISRPKILKKTWHTCQGTRHFKGNSSPQQKQFVSVAFAFQKWD